MVILTGSYTGIVYQCALELAKLITRALIIGCRNEEKGKEDSTTISEKGYKMVEFIKFELKDL